MKNNSKIPCQPIIDDTDFYFAIQRTIADGRHADYLQGVLDDYAWYKREFQRVFTSEQSHHGIYTFRVNYLLKKSVWREFELMGKDTFNDFAEAIIDSMAWDNDHAHGFGLTGRERKSATGDGHRVDVMMFTPGWDDDPFPVYKTDQVLICQIDYQKVPRLDFIFDFGDGHRFEIVFRGLKEPAKNQKAKDFPRMTDQRGVAPEQYPEVGE